ncbi:MAG: hypothetical protein LBU47_07325, partial [Christensenellaceae bacterium]|nr:hypothetical protein [Christensenellaceae bacterium]
MNGEQRARIKTLYERVLTLFEGKQQHPQKISGAAEKPERQLEVIKNLLGAKDADAPLSLLEEKYAYYAAEAKAKQQLDAMVERKMAQNQREYYDAMLREV